MEWERLGQVENIQESRQECTGTMRERDSTLTSPDQQSARRISGREDNNVAEVTDGGGGVGSGSDGDGGSETVVALVVATTTTAMTTLPDSCLY